jgi:hypothetical protein
MNIEPIRVKPMPGYSQCKKIINWDQDSLTLSVLFTYSANETSQSDMSLSDRLSQEFGIGQGDYRLVIGDMDLLLDRNKRIESLEIRTNPVTWESCELLPVSGKQEAMNIDFIVDYDENRIASYDLPIRIIRDHSMGVLSFCFGGYTSSQWSCIADGFIVGMTADHYLSEFRLLGFKDN